MQYLRCDLCKILSITQQQLYSVIDLVRKSFQTFWGMGVLYVVKFYKISVDCIVLTNISLQ